MIRKGGSNWVDAENFFDRETELEALVERVREGTHTLLTAQRRMGKTSLVRELQRRLAETGDFEVVFVDLEAATDPADAIA
ncbi:MAG: AAA family ATPase, partial [Rhodospirillaceae bacterium]|nr:AAA family ATPase [Rhodospirillaceae bacterium]